MRNIQRYCFELLVLQIYLIVTKTDYFPFFLLRYAKQMITRKRRTNTLTNSSRFRLWERQGKVTLSEMKGFLAVIFNMGLVRKPSIKD
jgi:hypothetical protein